MKKITNLFSGLLFLAAFLVACDKKEDLATFNTGNSVTLTSSATTVAAAPADSNNVALRLTWTNPNFATDSANNKYIVQIDSTGRNFTKATTREVTGTLTTAFLAKELNLILLNMGFAINTPYDVDVRVIASYANNNDRKFSNTVKIRMTPYKVPPKIALPASGNLFIVGSATAGTWNNPVPVPTQQFGRLSETQWGGVFNLSANGEYLILPVNGDWSNKYSVANKNLAGLSAGGDFGFNQNDNIPGPATAGWYKILLDFQTGKFTVTPYTGFIASPLYITGDATPGGWVNNPPMATQTFTRLNSIQYQISSLAITGAKQFKLVPTYGSWDNLYGLKAQADDKLSGTFQYNAGNNIDAPAISGNYKIEVNMFDESYKLTKL
jgi:hypothetical protein